MALHPKPTVPPFNPSRRLVLKAAGVSITLPFLESLAPKAAWGQAVQAPSGPTRFIAMVHPQGFPLADYDGTAYANLLYPGQTGGFPSTLPTTLVPLATRGVANEVMLLGGLHHDADPASVSGAHTPYTAGRVLIGKNYDDSDAGAKISSLDVAIHHAIGKNATLGTQRLTLGLPCKSIYVVPLTRRKSSMMPLDRFRFWRPRALAMPPPALRAA